MVKILVCGGRKYADFLAVDRALSRFFSRHDVKYLIQGGADGADQLAKDWCDMNHIPCLNVPANWPKYNLAAGPIRNEKMLTYGPDVVMSFPGGKGTNNMKKLALGANIPILDGEKYGRTRKENSTALHRP